MRENDVTHVSGINAYAREQFERMILKPDGNSHFLKAAVRAALIHKNGAVHVIHDAPEIELREHVRRSIGTHVKMIDGGNGLLAESQSIQRARGHYVLLDLLRQIAEQMPCIAIKNVFQSLPAESHLHDPGKGLVHIRKRIGAGKHKALGEDVIRRADVLLSHGLVVGGGKVHEDVAVTHAHRNGLVYPRIAPVTYENTELGKIGGHPVQTRGRRPKVRRACGEKAPP